MTKADQLRAVYAELRRTLGADVPAKELVHYAHLIVKTYHDPAIEGDDETLEQGRLLSIVNRPLDEAFADGGWRVLEFEARGSMPFDDGEFPLWAIRDRVKRLIGSA